MSSDEEANQSFTKRLTSATSRGTGYLELQDAARERRSWVFLEDNDVVAVLVDGYRPRLARRLTASGFVSKAEMGEVLTVAKDDYDPRIAVECVVRGLVNEATMKALYREFMLSAASTVNEWKLGESRWVAGVPPWEGRSLAVSVPLLVKAIERRQKHWAKLWSGLALATIPDQVPARIGPRYYRPDGADEAAVLWAVNGTRTLDEVAGECGFTRFQAGHVVAALMAKKVLDLLPAVGPPLSPDPLTVEAGYFADFQPIPTDSTNETTHETTQVAVTVPVSADNPEGNVVTQHVDGTVNVDGHPDGPLTGIPDDHTPDDAVADLVVADPGQEPDRPAQEDQEPLGEAPEDQEPLGAGPDNQEPLKAAGENQEPDGDATDNQEPLGAARDNQEPVPATDLGEFFVNNDLMTAAPAETDSEGTFEPVPASAAHQPGLPPLPAITGGPSDFYAVLPSTLPTQVAGQASAQNTGVAQGAEVAQLRGDLLRLAAERAGALEQAAHLHEETARHSAIADETAAQGDEADVSIARLNTVKSEASATAASRLEALELARAEEIRIAAARAQLDQDAEEVRKTLLESQREYDESVAAEDPLERDLEAQIAQRVTITEAWRAATDSAVECAAAAGLAEAAAGECHRLIEEGRQRLTELANTAANG